MADSTSKLVTNEDVEAHVLGLKEDFNTKVIFFNVGMTDFDGEIYSHYGLEPKKSGKYATRLKSDQNHGMNLIPKKKIVKQIRENRKDIFLVAFKTTSGAKPSVGGQSQRIIFNEHNDYDCIVHFHCPIKPTSDVPVVSQREYECGSHECGQNTSNGLKRFGNLSAVMLDEHGPNIVFHHSIVPTEVIDFIKENFDLSDKTGGLVEINKQLEIL